MANRIQTSSKANREAARRTNTRARRERITAQAMSGGVSTGDFTNSSAMRSANRSLVGQTFGTRQTRYRDLVAAFGRARSERGGRGLLAFSAG